MSAAPLKGSSSPSKDETANALASAHRRIDPNIQSIFRLVDTARETDPNEPVKLLEINQSSTATGIMPVYFTPAPGQGIHYSSVIIELHPSEWDQLQQGLISLPKNWNLDKQL
jgi:hypothetical protein